jgi:SAM-dependent methyltransferase
MTDVFAEALRTLPQESEESRAYFEKHLDRLAKTLALAPRSNGGKALELGCYMQITPFLQRLLNYREVRGAYYGKLGKRETRTVSLPDGEFTCRVDLFDAERDRFPYRDRTFELVVASEIIEHMIYDPMHTLVEAQRVLIEGGHLVVSTPNSASYGILAKVLDGKTNPKIFPQYKRPDKGQPEVGHVHEYTAHELGLTIQAAGFEIERLFTTPIEEYASHQALAGLLEANGYGTENRGEQTWCIAVKRGALPVDRYPAFLYA